MVLYILLRADGLPAAVPPVTDRYLCAWTVTASDVYDPAHAPHRMQRYAPSDVDTRDTNPEVER